MYKTILLHVDGSERQRARLRVAAALAKAYDAHLVGSAVTGVSWTDYALLSGSIGAPFADGDFDGLREAAGARLEAFTLQARDLDVAATEARLLDEDARYALLLQSRYADLVVLSQDGVREPGLPPQVPGLPQHVALHGARPVLVVPPAWDGAMPARNAVVGWDGSAQALRAIEGALPLLKSATNVQLALVNPDTLSQLHGDEPGADLALYLARHGVHVEVVIERTRDYEGDALMQLARNANAGLLVAGAFGHSRYREWILGGVTQALLQRCPVPLLLAH